MTVAEEARAPHRVLVVDDEQFSRELVASALRFAGFDVEQAADGYAALERSRSFAPDLVLLDVMMPLLDGLEVCRRLRQAGDRVPVIFLTARDANDDKVAGFGVDADDYVTKPFSLDELVARIRAVLKRAGRGAETPDGTTYGSLVLDDRRHRVTLEGGRVELSPTEFRLLRLLLLNAERVLSRNQILEHVWGHDYAGESSVVETYVFYLRRKLGSARHLIRTVRGVGYMLADDRGERGERQGAR